MPYLTMFASCLPTWEGLCCWLHRGHPIKPAGREEEALNAQPGPESGPLASRPEDGRGHRPALM